MAEEDKRITITVLAFITLGLCIPIMIYGGHLGVSSGTYCVPYLSWWFLGLGLAIGLVSPIGMISSYRGYHRTLVSYLVGKTMLVFILLVILGVSFGTLDRRGRDFWDDRVANDVDRWNGVIRCLKASRVCERTSSYSECCEKPLGCGDPSVSSTVNDTVSAQDCFLWFGGAGDFLCFTCLACQSRVFSIFMENWNSAKPGLVSLGLVVMGVLVVEWLAFFGAWELLQNTLLQLPQQQQGQGGQEPVEIEMQEMHPRRADHEQ